MKKGDEYWFTLSNWNYLDVPKSATKRRKKTGDGSYTNQVLKRAIMITKTGHIWEYA